LYLSTDQVGLPVPNNKTVLLSSIFQHRVYSELITHNLTQAVKRDVNSVENDRLITLITTMVIF